MNGLRAMWAAASAAGLLPWILAGVLAASAALSGAGFYAGHHWAASSCEAEKSESQLAAMRHQAEAVAKAQSTSDRIWNIGLELNVDLAVMRGRAQQRTNEVTRYVDADPDLAACRVRADVQRVRDDQVRDSEQLAAHGRAVRR
jgi:hypothetical protein